MNFTSCHCWINSACVSYESDFICQKIATYCIHFAWSQSPLALGRSSAQKLHMLWKCTIPIMKGLGYCQLNRPSSFPCLVLLSHGKHSCNCTVSINSIAFPRCHRCGSLNGKKENEKKTSQNIMAFGCIVRRGGHNNNRWSFRLSPGGHPYSMPSKASRHDIV